MALCLPRLGAFGLWEPWELGIAEKARAMADTLSLGGALETLGRGQLTLLLQAIGIRVLGPSETGVRLLGAFAGIGALMALYWAGVGLFRPRAALLAVLALGTTPLFALSSRQATSDMPLVAALALTIGGFGRWTWPADGRRRGGPLLIGLAGLALGYASGGALLGVALPGFALVLAVLIAKGLVARVAPTATTATATVTAAAPGTADAAAAPTATDPAPATDDGTAGLAAAGVGPDIEAGRSLGASLRARPVTIAVLAALAALSVFVLVSTLTRLTAGHNSALIAGTPHLGAPTTTFDYLVRQLGFGLFPWSAVAFFALARPLIRIDDDGDAPTNPRLAFGQTYLLLFAGLGFALSTYVVLVLGESRFVGLAAIGLALGAFLDEALEGNRSEPVAGLLMATGTMVVARDFFLSPEDLASVHLLGEKLKWPPSVSVGYAVLGLGLVVALGIYAALATRGVGLGKIKARELGQAPRWRRAVEPRILDAGRFGLQVAVGAAVVFGFWLTQSLVPRLSAHFSFKPVMESYARYAKHGERFARYRIEGKGTSFYSGVTMTDLPTQESVVAFLRSPDRVFALVSADELAPLDAALRTAHAPYFAVNAASSRFLLLSNRLDADETDQNPLKRDVWMAPTPPPATGPWIVSEAPPWKWRVPITAMFGDSIEVVGVNFPPVVHRPGKIALELYFRVRTRPPGGYKIFVHLDGPATPRLIGDHDPVNKAFPTAYWLPGEYIHDLFDIDVPLMTTPAGTYRIFVGFWPGGDGKRIKLTQDRSCHFHSHLWAQLESPSQEDLF